jgi:ubiquinone/menaquinone biosynthesis C-methylase UbiE
VIGVDHAMPMLAQARAYALAEGLPISFVRAKAQALPLAPGAAAALAMGGSLNEIGDVDGALGELRRVLAPAGRCALMCLARAETGPGQALQGLLGLGGISFPPLDELNHMLARAGLRLRAQWRYRVVVFSLLTG